MKLELKHLAPYLPYGLKIRYIERNETHIFDTSNLKAVCSEQIHLRPILRPLSDFTDINSESMNKLNTDLNIQMELNKLALKFKHYTSCSYSTMQLCFENHIDVFGLIEKGLAIDFNETFTQK